MNKTIKNVTVTGARRTDQLQTSISEKGERASADNERKYRKVLADLDRAVDQIFVNFSYGFAALLEFPVFVMDALKRRA